MAGFDWDQLIYFIRRREVIPVVGRDLCAVPLDGRLVPLDTYLAVTIAREVAGLADVGEHALWSLQRVSSLPRFTGSGRPALYSRINALVKSLDVPIPESLCKLAQIDHFPLFVSTTFDSLLARAINAHRYGGDPRTTTLSYSRGSNTADTPALGPDPEGAIVFRLFGRATPSPDDFAVTDEDTLEFLHALQSEHRQPKRLFNELRTKHLLLLGCGYPDWLARFFLRTVKNERLLESNRFKWVADDRVRSDPGLVMFMTQFQTQVWDQGNATDFVSELRKRWDEIEVDPEAIPDDSLVPPGMVFLSYPREDTARALEVKSALEAADIETWFDKDRIPPGADWERKIRAAIRRCSIFIPCLSRTTDLRQAGYFREEWRMACLESRRYFGSSRRYLMPVIVDGLPGIPGQVPDEFRVPHVPRLAEGCAPLVTAIAEELRRLQASGTLQRS